ncbi:MAG: hypothetical protein FWE27_05200 [Defluviitaleaceae bacterium]|nr:hypothetical protein [Defluviitaleaceae bacterium]
MKPKKLKYKAIIVLTAFMIMGVTLTGCNNGSNPPAETAQPVTTISPQDQERRDREISRPPDPDATIPPELRHPDGSVG